MNDAARDHITLTVNGTAVDAAPGQTVASVLVGRGVTAWRQTRHQGKPRGLFCGIGVCYDCLITIDGVANQRACIIEATQGTTVEGDFHA